MAIKLIFKRPKFVKERKAKLEELSLEILSLAAARNAEEAVEVTTNDIAGVAAAVKERLKTAHDWDYTEDSPIPTVSRTGFIFYVRYHQVETTITIFGKPDI